MWDCCVGVAGTKTTRNWESPPIGRHGSLDIFYGVILKNVARVYKPTIGALAPP